MARAIVRTAASPSSIASMRVSSGRKSQKPSIINTASDVPAIKRSRDDAFSCSAEGLTTSTRLSPAPPSSPSTGT
eukprot:5409458-Prymnesium_polylepis.2